MQAKTAVHALKQQVAQNALLAEQGLCYSTMPIFKYPRASDGQIAQYERTLWYWWNFRSNPAMD
jgi:hypothetical protein